MWFLAEAGLALYGAMVGGIYAFQRRLMYHPVKSIKEPPAYGLASMREVTFTSHDGTRLQGWAQEARKGFPGVIYFHGNAGNLADRAAKFSAMTEAGFGVLALSYRGFGKSDGSPSETGIYDDARAAIDYARTHLNLPQNKIIYYGESLGSGVAVQMATERPPALLVLEAAYMSVETRSAELYPFVLGVRALVRDKYDSLSKIKDVHAPLLMLHGDLDQVIPLAHGQVLFATANEPKQMVVYPEVHHADYSGDHTVQPLLASARKYALIRA